MGYGGMGSYGGYSPYSSYGIGYGGMGSYGGYSPYSSYGSYGYGGMGGYGGNDYMGSSIARQAEESSRPAFQSIESIVQAFTSVSMMLDSTFQAVYNSFRAVIGVADNFTRLKTQFAQVSHGNYKLDKENLSRGHWCGLGKLNPRDDLLDLDWALARSR